MKYFSINSAAALIPLFVIAGTSYSQIQEQWKVEIGIEKNSFLMREPIWLDVVVTNISKDTLRARGLYPPCQGSWFCIELTDSAGTPVEYTGPLYDMYWGDGIPMSPMESNYHSFDILYLFGDRTTSTYHLPALTPGKYFVQGEYLKARSNKINFTVIELTGKEKEVEKATVAAYKKDFGMSGNEARPNLKKTLDFYPNSVFAEIMAHLILEYSDFLERFPNSGHTRSSLTGVMIGLTKEEKIKYLENAIHKYQGTRAARHAEQLLKMLEK